MDIVKEERTSGRRKKKVKVCRSRQRKLGWGCGLRTSCKQKVWGSIPHIYLKGSGQRLQGRQEMERTTANWNRLHFVCQTLQKAAFCTRKNRQVAEQRTGKEAPYVRDRNKKMDPSGTVAEAPLKRGKQARVEMEVQCRSRKWDFHILRGPLTCNLYGVQLFTTLESFISCFSVIFAECSFYGT